MMMAQPPPPPMYCYPQAPFAGQQMYQMYPDAMNYGPEVIVRDKQAENEEKLRKKAEKDLENARKKRRRRLGCNTHYLCSLWGILRFLLIVIGPTRQQQ